LFLTIVLLAELLRQAPDSDQARQAGPTIRPGLALVPHTHHIVGGMQIPSWLIETLGVAMNGLALIIITIWAAVITPREYLSPVKEGKKKAKVVESSPKKRKLHIVLLCALIVLVACSFTLQVMSAFHQHTYDTDTIKYYRDKFDSDRLVQWRIKAARTLAEYRSGTNKKWDSLANGTDDLDEVLGFFDDLGYDEQHGKISAEVVYQEFYQDIFFYYQCSEEYISYCQKTDSKEDYVSIKPMFDDIEKIESKKTGQPISALAWSDKDISDYLKSEMALTESK
jgi:hypothetical protein